MQVGIDSFAAAFDENSRAVNPADRLRQLVEQIEHADEVGLDAFGVGEHHRREFLDSAPAVILGAAAARTQRIRLTSAVTVLSAEDPGRVFQSFATIDLLSRGRADMIVGRGSSVEAFPLFGFRLEDYDALFGRSRSAGFTAGLFSSKAAAKLSIPTCIGVSSEEDRSIDRAQRRRSRATR